MALRWLAVCREKGCGWDAVLSTAAEAHVVKAQHERDQAGHHASVAAVEADQSGQRPFERGAKVA